MLAQGDPLEGRWPACLLKRPRGGGGDRGLEIDQRVADVTDIDVRHGGLNEREREREKARERSSRLRRGGLSSNGWLLLTRAVHTATTMIMIVGNE
jgi:hypothetical protein